MATTIYDTTFSHDWNVREGKTDGKLQCAHFTTLRLYSLKYAPGTIHRIWNNQVKGKSHNHGYATVISRIIFQLKDLERHDVLCRLDTGYGWDETKNLLMKMYKDLNINEETWLCFALFRYLTKLEIQVMTDKMKSDSQTTLA